MQTTWYLYNENFDSTSIGIRLTYNNTKYGTQGLLKKLKMNRGSEHLSRDRRTRLNGPDQRYTERTLKSVESISRLSSIYMPLHGVAYLHVGSPFSGEQLHPRGHGGNENEVDKLQLRTDSHQIHENSTCQRSA